MFDCLALSSFQIGEVAPLSPGRADVADAVVHAVPVLDLVNLDPRMTLLDRDRELVWCAQPSKFGSLKSIGRERPNGMPINP